MIDTFYKWSSLHVLTKKQPNNRAVRLNILNMIMFVIMILNIIKYNSYFCRYTDHAVHEFATLRIRICDV